MVDESTINGWLALVALDSWPLSGLKAIDAGVSGVSKGAVLSRLKLNELGSLAGIVGFDNDESRSGGSSEGKLARVISSEFSNKSVAIETEKQAIMKARTCMIEREVTDLNLKSAGNSSQRHPVWK